MRNSPDEEKLEIVREALRHTELHLTGLENLASNADRRATAFIAGGVAFAAFLFSLAEFLPSKTSLLIGAGFSLICSGVTISSILPKKFHILGHRWKDWKGHIEDEDSLVDVLISQAEENDARIDHNFKALEKSARRFRVAVAFLMLSAIIALSGQIYSQWEDQFISWCSRNAEETNEN